MYWIDLLFTYMNMSHVSSLLFTMQVLSQFHMQGEVLRVYTCTCSYKEIPGYSDKGGGGDYILG